MFKWMSQFTNTLFARNEGKTEELDSFSRFCLYIL